MPGHFVRRTLLAVLAAIPLVFAGQSSPVSAACITGALPSASVTGIVVSTSIEDLGVIVDVQADDGTTRQVSFWGRNPTDTLGGTENTIEDAWAGSLPEVGGRYAITGDFNGEDEPITVSNCAQSPSVEILAAPPTATTTTTLVDGTDDDGISTPAVVGLTIGAVAVLTILGFLLRRRSQPGA